MRLPIEYGNTIGYKLSLGNGAIVVGIAAVVVLNSKSDIVECCLLECDTGIEEEEEVVVVGGAVVTIVAVVSVVVNGVETVVVSNELMCRF